MSFGKRAVSPEKTFRRQPGARAARSFDLAGGVHYGGRGGTPSVVWSAEESNLKLRLLLGLCLTSNLLTAQNLTGTMMQRYFTGIRRNLEASADVMPADKYSFRLTADQMTFGEWLIHSIERNYTDCATLKSEPVPDAQKQAAGLKDKPAISQALKDSFSYCAAALAPLDDAKVIASPQMSYSFMHIAVHNNEIYGNIVGYMRVSGVVPPSTAARQNQKK